MKRIFILLVIAAIAVPTFAAEAKLIDFSLLTADTTVGDRPENEATLLDFSDVAGASIDPQLADEMQTSLFMDNWDVTLNSSAQTPRSLANSYAQEAEVRQEAERNGGDMVLGARMVFPTEPYNAWALIQPPFEIPAYGDIDFSGGYGVVRNVGVIKQIGLEVFGLNFPHRISVILQDENNEQEEVFMGPLNFDGFRQLVWDNPNYIDDVRDRELRQYPLYPNLEPMRKLIGFRVYRDGADVGGDFVTYIHSVTIVYDEAVLQFESDINHDELWHIMSTREEDRRAAEAQRLGNLQVLRSVERELQATESIDPNAEP